MPPTRQSARPKTRAARRRSHVASTAVPVHPLDRAVASTAAPAPPIDPSERATAAKPTGTARRRWEADVMNRLDATEHLSREMHEMRSLLKSALPSLGSSGGQTRTPVTTTSSSQQGAVQSAPGDGRQAAAVAAAASDVLIQQGAVRSVSEVPVNQVFPPEACHAGPSVGMNAERGGGMLSAPWAIVSGIDDSILNLPGATQGRVSKFITKSLSLHGHVSEKLRIKVWSDEFVDLNSLLPEVSLVHQDMTLTIRPEGDSGCPAICVATKPKAEIRTFHVWSKAFDIFCSVYLLKPTNIMHAPQFLKYRHTIRSLCERGGNWRGYDESFRALRGVEGWAWDEIHSELWLHAAQPSIPKVATASKQPFLNKGQGSRTNGLCFTFNSSGQCPFNPCRFRHMCRWCGGGHPGVRCPTSKRKTGSQQQQPQQQRTGGRN